MYQEANKYTANASLFSKMLDDPFIYGTFIYGLTIASPQGGESKYDYAPKLALEVKCG